MSEHNHLTEAQQNAITDAATRSIASAIHESNDYLTEVVGNYVEQMSTQERLDVLDTLDIKALGFDPTTGRQDERSDDE